LVELVAGVCALAISVCVFHFRAGIGSLLARYSYSLLDEEGNSALMAAVAVVGIVLGLVAAAVGLAETL